MSVIGGKDGAVDGHKVVRGWNISHSADLQSVIASNTKGGSVTLPGNKNWSGSFRCYGHIPAVKPGESFTFTGSIDGTNGATGTARVGNITLSWDHEGSGVINYEVTFQANGALTLGSAAATDTSDFENVEGSSGCLVKIDVPGGSAWPELEDVRSGTLTLTAANQEYRSSSTAGETKSMEGPLSWTLSLNLYSGATLTDLPEPNEVKAIRLMVNATEYWELLWGRFGEMSNIEVNPEDGTLVNGTLNASMHGIETIGEAVTVGSIKHPDGASGQTTIWPPA